MAKPEFRILKDSPEYESYGQYVYDITNPFNPYPGKDVLFGDLDDLVTMTSDEALGMHRLFDMWLGGQFFITNIWVDIQRHKYTNRDMGVFILDSETPSGAEIEEAFATYGGSEHSDASFDKIDNVLNSSRRAIRFKGDADEKYGGVKLLTCDASDDGSYFYPNGVDGFPDTNDDDVFNFDWPFFEYWYGAAAFWLDFYSFQCGVPYSTKSGQNNGQSFQLDGTDFNHGILVGLCPEGSTGCVDKINYGGGGGGGPYGTKWNYPTTGYANANFDSYGPLGSPLPEDEEIFNMLSWQNLSTQFIVGNIWVCIRSKGDQRHFGWGGWENRTRDKRVECYKIPKNDFLNHGWLTPSDYDWNEQEHYSEYPKALNYRETRGYWASQVNMLSELEGLGISFIPPKKSQIPPFSNYSSDYSSEQFAGWVNPRVYQWDGDFRFYNLINSLGEEYSKVDYTGVYLGDGETRMMPENVVNFQPVAYAHINDINVQSYYTTDDPEYYLTTAPNLVNVNMDVYSQNSYDVESENNTYWTFLNDDNVYDLASVQNDLNQSFKFFIADWGDCGSDDCWNVEDWPQSYNDLQEMQSEDKFIVYDILDGGTASHQYIDSGNYTITAYVMSVAERENNEPCIDAATPCECGDNNYCMEHMVLRWKKVEIRISISLDLTFYPDYLDLGGVDFVFIPWPYTSPIIGGLSDESDYRNSLKTIINNDKFVGSERFDKSYAYLSYTNDELGQHLGRVDLWQTRFFTSAYSLADLLEIELDSQDKIISYYTDLNEYWDGTSNKFSLDSSVGSIFINDSYDLNLSRQCLIELNPGFTDGLSVRDTSGNSNQGIIIGDYGMSKPEKGIRIGRDALIKRPVLGDSDGVI